MQANVQSFIESITPYPSFTNINQAGLVPQYITSAYNIPAGDGAGVKIGIISLAGGWIPSDFDNSMSDLGLSSQITSANITTVLIDGATNSNVNDSSGGENTLDLYCVAGMAPKANIVLYVGQNQSVTFSTSANNAATLNNTNSFANVINRAVNENCDIITISWGLQDTIISSNVSYYCGDFLAAPLANAAAQGTTVFIAAGDYGAIPTRYANIVMAQYPTTSPNCISVGGTHLTVNPGAGNVRLTETVEYNNPIYPSGWGSGGGISAFIPVPTWQANLTYQQYFKANSTAGPVTTLTRRGVPDISAAMNTYGLWYNGVISGFAGTSASAPIMAGMFARYMSNNGGRRPIPNAIHQVLYNNLDAYYDITTGNNATVTYLNGYAASSSWDPVTGVGVPWGNLVYQMVNSGGTTIKSTANTWNYVANVQVKTAANTWSNVRSIYTKTINGWQQTY